ncbi:MAG: hypothetical protein U0905_06700 [Pirellulales bacterium]
MSFRIREFQNTDVTHLAGVWQQHYARAGLVSSCPSTVWECCVFSKPYFDPGHFLVACRNDQPVGFIHIAFGANDDRSDLAMEHGLINAMCVSADADEDQVAMALLAEAQLILLRVGVKQLIATSSPNRFAFYVGLGPTDGLLGVSMHDRRLQAWLHGFGMQPWQATSRWELDLLGFRPPMDRTQIQVRRQFQVNRVIDGCVLDWCSAVAYGHAEQQYFQLSSRVPGGDRLDVLYWQPDPTIRGLEGAGYLMTLANVPQESEGRDRYVFLLSESLRQLHLDRVDRIRTYLFNDDTSATHVLQRLGFQCIEHGMVYQKSLAG